MELILASSSPRRQELLSAARIPFAVQSSNIPEDIRPGEAPQDFSERLAFEKANSIWNDIGRKTNSVVLGADTIVVIDEHVLGKPADVDDARRMLRMISGRAHLVITSVCLLGNGIHDVRSETTIVHVDRIPELEIDEYISTGEPMDKAGAYGIQGMASRWITRIDGDYPNVVGLPVAMVYRMLRDISFQA